MNALTKSPLSASRTAMAKKGPKPTAKEKTPAKDNVPDIYREMLAEAASSSPTQRSEDGKAVKRRRVGGRIFTQVNDDTTSYRSDQSSNAPNKSDLDELFEDVQPAPQQMLQSDSEDSAGSDFNWEEVDLSEQLNQARGPEPGEGESGDLDLVLHDKEHERISSGRGKAKRKPITAEEKMLRLEIHKIHLCSLLAHVYLRNNWCNDDRVQVRSDCVPMQYWKLSSISPLLERC